MPVRIRRRGASTVRNGHEYLRKASDTIHQHRISLASQIRDFDDRWAHLYTVAPVLNKLSKGRQKPDEFRENAEVLFNDVQQALEHAHTRKLEQIPEDGSSIIPGPLPVKYKLRPVSKVSSFHWITGSETASARGAVKAFSPRRGMEPIPESPPTRSATLKRNKTIKKRQSRPRLSFRNPFRNRPPPTHHSPAMGHLSPNLPTNVDGQAGSIDSAKLHYNDFDADGIPKQRRGPTRSSSRERRRRHGRSSSRSNTGSRGGSRERRHRTPKEPIPPMPPIPPPSVNNAQPFSSASAQAAAHTSRLKQQLPDQGASHHRTRSENANITEPSAPLTSFAQTATPNDYPRSHRRSRSHSKSHSAENSQTTYVVPPTHNTIAPVGVATATSAVPAPYTTSVVPPGNYVEPHVSPTDEHGTRGRHRHKLTKAPKLHRHRDQSIDPVPVIAPPTSYVVPHQSTAVYNSNKTFANVGGGTSAPAHAKAIPVIPSIQTNPVAAPGAQNTFSNFVVPPLYPDSLQAPSHTYPPQVNDRYYTGVPSIKSTSRSRAPVPPTAPTIPAPGPGISSASAQARAHAKKNKAQAGATVDSASPQKNLAPYIIDVIPSANPAQGYFVVPRTAGYGHGQPQSVTTPTGPVPPPGVPPGVPGTGYVPTQPGPGQAYIQQYMDQQGAMAMSSSPTKEKKKKRDRGEKNPRSHKHSSHSHSHSSSPRKHRRERDRDHGYDYNYDYDRGPSSSHHHQHSRSKSHSHSSSRHHERGYGYDYDYSRDHDRDRYADRDRDRRHHRSSDRHHHRSRPSRHHDRYYDDDNSGTDDERHYYSDRSGKSSRSVKYSDSNHPERKPVHRSPPPPVPPTGRVFAFAPLMSKFKENFSMHSTSVRGASSVRR